VKFDFAPFAAGSCTLSVIIVRTNGNRTDETLAVYTVQERSALGESRFPPASAPLSLYASYPCSVTVFQARLVDTLEVVLRQADTAETIVFIDSQADTGWTVFSFRPIKSGQCTLAVYIAWANGARRTEKTVYTVVDQAPAIASKRLPADGSMLKLNFSYPCTLEISRPQFVDTLLITLRQAANIDTIMMRDSMAADSPKVSFRVVPGRTGVCTLDVALIGVEGTRSAESAAFMVYDPVPAVTASVSRAEVNLDGAVTLSFDVADPDSNLWMAFAGIDSADAAAHTVTFSPFSHTKSHSFTRTFSGDTLKRGLAGGFIYYCQAIDYDSLVSAMAVCTVIAVDTTRPVVTLLPPYNDPSVEIDSLPVVISARVTDNWTVDSVKFNASDMVLLNDTASVSVSLLDSGTSTNTIQAWDRAGNARTLSFTLKYKGPPVYPPRIRPLDKTITEGRRFDTLWLDTCVETDDPHVTNPAAWAQTLTWVVTDSAGFSWPHYAPASHKCVLPVLPVNPALADSEWTCSYRLTFQVIAPNSLTDTRHGQFTVTEIPDTPLITLGNQWSASGVFDTFWVDTCATDPDNASSTLAWTFLKGTYYTVNKIMKPLGGSPKSSAGGYTIDPLPLLVWTRRIVVAPIDGSALPSGWLSDTLTFTATDPGGLSREKKIQFSKGHLIIWP